MVVPGLYGYVSATKWVVDLELTTFDAFDPYWVRRGWAAAGTDQDAVAHRHAEAARARSPPGRSASPASRGRSTAASTRVEVRIDEGDWQPAELAAERTIDTWRQWSSRGMRRPATTRSRCAPRMRTETSSPRSASSRSRRRDRMALRRRHASLDPRELNPPTEGQRPDVQQTPASALPPVWSSHSRSLAAVVRRR